MNRMIAIIILATSLNFLYSNIVEAGPRDGVILLSAER